MRYALLAVLALAPLLSTAEARADLRSARARFQKGDYKGAEAALAKIKGKQVDAGRLEVARIRLRTGRHAEAEKLARALTKSSDSGTAAEARMFLAEVLRERGKLPEAKKELEPIVQTQPDRMRARYLLALVYADLGDPRHTQVWQGIKDELDPGKINIEEVEPLQLFYLAESARYTSEFQFANDVYRETVDRAPGLHEVNVAWGHLFLEKYAPADAQESFDEVLKRNPRHPDAHAGMAAVKLEASYDLAGATSHIGQALAVNPRHVPALLLRAGIEIDRNQWDKAKATVSQVFAVNPHNLEGHSLMATVHWLRDDTAGYQAIKKKVLSSNPTYARFFHIVARSAVREHRYREAIELEKEAVAVQPDYYEAMEAIGTGYLRLGLEKEGLEWLRRAWKGDEYNLRTKNTLDLFEDWIPKEYVFASSKNFKIRYHKDERAVYRRYLEPLLEQAFGDMSRRYGFRPKTPVVLELFQNADHYSVRTIGLPNLNALGVCFGQVITAMSPSVGDINWAMVLWHELGHVFAIQLSNSRVPRWFTEGLSEYETVLARPEWRRENDADVWAAMQDGTLPSLAELNYGFMKPNMQEVVVAYHTSSLAVEYLAQTYGFNKIVAALKLFGQGLETPEVLEKMSGKRLAVLDGDFRAWLEARFAPYQGTFHLPGNLGKLSALSRAAAAAPKSAEAQARLALGQFYEGQAPRARAAAEKALALYADQHLALYVLAELDLREGDTASAKKRYESLIETGADNFDLRVRLGQVEINRGDFDRAIRHLCTAKVLDPERAYPYQVLADLYQRQGKKEEALRELETYVMIEQMQLGYVMKLVDGYAGLNKWDKVRSFGELALEISLADADLFVTLGKAYLETAAPDRALYSYDTALLVTPAMRRPAVAHIGRARALLALGDKAGARKAVALALKTEPDSAEARQLKAELGR
jgi:tetratricopeptide (TPR) repeat protein